MKVSRLNWQPAVTAAVVVVVAFLVILPLVFLVEESLNTGDPMAFPPVEYGLKNYIAMFDEDINVLWNTLIIAIMATVMAIAIGFTLAWILTRTNVPGRAALERLMELPYYMTPLVGALAWSVIAGPKSGFVNQLWKVAGGRGDLVGEGQDGVLEGVGQPQPIGALLLQPVVGLGHGLDGRVDDPRSALEAAAHAADEEVAVEPGLARGRERGGGLAHVGVGQVEEGVDGITDGRQLSVVAERRHPALDLHQDAVDEGGGPTCPGEADQLLRRRVVHADAGCDRHAAKRSAVAGAGRANSSCVASARWRSIISR